MRNLLVLGFNIGSKIIITRRISPEDPVKVEIVGVVSLESIDGYNRARLGFRAPHCTGFDFPEVLSSKVLHPEKGKSPLIVTSERFFRNDLPIELVEEIFKKLPKQNSS